MIFFPLVNQNVMKKTVTTRQFELEGNGSQNELKKDFERMEKAWISFFKPEVILVAPVTGMTVAPKLKILK